ncbi:UNVERIFIED_CONTAM: hypothetical protein K2H54_060753 [Gekko kuhli]
MAPKQDAYFMGLVKMLRHFRWTWIGLLAPDNDQGERFLRTLTSVVIRRGICIAFTESIPELNLSIKFIFQTDSLFKQTNCNVFIYYGDCHSILMLGIMMKGFEKIGKFIVGKIWITAVWHDFNLRCFFEQFDIQHIHGSFSFLTQKSRNTKYDNLNPFLSTVREIGERAFRCSYSNDGFSVKGWKRCREKKELEAPSQDELESILSQDSYSIYNVINVVAHALNAASLSRSDQKLKGDWLGLQKVQPWQLHPYLRNFQFLNNSMEGVYFDENGNMAVNFDILNWVEGPNRSIVGVNVGSVQRQSSPEMKFTINQNAIAWPRWFNEVGKIYCF